MVLLGFPPGNACCISYPIIPQSKLETHSLILKLTNVTQEQLLPAYTEFQFFQLLDPTFHLLTTNRTPGPNQHLLSQRLFSSHHSLQHYESYWVVRKTPSETNHSRKITAQIPRAANKSRFPAAHTNNLNEAESNASYNTNSGWKKRSTDCGKLQLKKQPQVPVQQESKQRFLNTELNFKSSLHLYFYHHLLCQK